MLPFFEQPAWRLGPLSIHAFGLTVAVAVWVSLFLVERRFQRDQLDVAIGRQLGGWIIAGGVLGAHVFSVLFYFPDRLLTDPWLLLRVWEDISSFGGMLGGIIGAALFFSIRARQLDVRSRVAYLDAIAFVFPIGLAIGRFGCTLAHDHPGVVTTFPLGISLRSPAAQAYISQTYAEAGLSLPAAFASMSFHDLGFYEFLFLVLIVVPAFLYWDRRRRAPGFYLAAFAGLYFPVRFALDRLRVADARYIGLTPDQWTAALILAVMPFVFGHRKARFAITGAVILATAAACWSSAGR